MTHTVTILGDSRAFDTYYTNAHYTARYGYEQTFPHVWRAAVLRDPEAGYDVVHIPDHFRGGTIQNNIIRLALTDPAIVVILDGIWETLLNRGHYNEYREVRQLREAPSGTRHAEYSHRLIVDLFKAGKLSTSPARYAERQRTLISYFRRRRRQVIWMTLPVLPKRYVGATYHAGDYIPVTHWEECLAAVNEAVIPVVRAYGGEILDLTELMNAAGGPEKALIDQWHFSPIFHALIARRLDELVRHMLKEAPANDHVSRAFMLGGPSEGNHSSQVIVYEGKPAAELPALRALSSDEILVYPHELNEIDNPRGDDRAEFEKQAVR